MHVVLQSCEVAIKKGKQYLLTYFYIIKQSIIKVYSQFGEQVIFPESTKYNVKQCSKDENKHSLKYEENNMAKEFPSDCTSKRKNSGFVEDFCVYILCY